MGHRDWFGEVDAGDEHPVLAAAHRRLERDESYRDVGAQVRELTTRLRESLDREQLRLLLDFEEALNRRAERLGAACYNIGVDDGLRMRPGDTARVTSTAQRLCALARELETLADELA